MNGGCAWAVWRLASIPQGGRQSRGAAAVDHGAAPAPSGLAVVARSPHLRNLAALVLLATLGAGLLDYVFKARAVAEIGRGESLLRFFALYYGAQNVLTFLAQVTLSRRFLEKLGLGPAVGLPSLAVIAGGLGALVVPGLPSVVVARGTENIGRASLFRSAYELLYTPVSAADKRAAKPIIDVAFDRTGDLAGAAITRLVLVSTRVGQHAIILLAAVATSARGACHRSPRDARVHPVTRTQPARPGRQPRDVGGRGSDDAPDAVAHAGASTRWPARARGWSVGAES